MFHIWYALPTALRAVLGLLMVGLSVLIYFDSDGHTIAVGLGVVGLIFLLFCDAGKNKGGYKF